MSGEPQGSSDCKKRPHSSIKRQAVSEVLDFSSQYGHDNSRSYTVSNVVGEPYNYPNYGDFTQTLVFVSSQFHMFVSFNCHSYVDPS